MDGGERELEREPPSAVSRQRQSQTRVLGRGEENERADARPPPFPLLDLSLTTATRARAHAQVRAHNTRARPGERASRRELEENAGEEAGRATAATARYKR